jgi:hypothetical protein
MTAAVPEATNLLQIIQSAASLATPLVLLFLGLLINRRLEQSKLTLSKERDWQTRWADSFLSRAQSFNDAVEDLVILLFQVDELSRKSDDVFKSRMDNKILLTNDARDRLQGAEWSLKIHLQFAPLYGTAVLNEAAMVFSLVSELLNTKQGDIDPIREALGRFNAAVRLAHRELLALAHRAD